MTFLKESHGYHKNYTPYIPQEKSAPPNQVPSSSENADSCKNETKPAEKNIREEPSFQQPEGTAKPCEINDEDLMRKYDEECIKWREEREKKKLENKDITKILFSFIRKNLTKLVIMALAVFALCAIYAKSFGISFSNSYDAIVQFIPSLGVAICCFVIWKFWRNKKPIEKSAVIYHELIPQMVKSHFGNAATFTQQSGFDCSEIYSNNSFRYHCYQTESAYFIDGTYRNMKFQMSYEQIRWGKIEKTEDGEKVVPETLFNGFLICTEIPRQVESHLGIYSHRISELNDILENSIETSTENLNFSRLFEIKCENEENIYYILTPDLMERITSLHPDNSNTYDELHIYWHENKMYVGISMNSSKMNIRDLKNGKEGYMQIKTQIESELKRAEMALEVVLKLL